MPTDWSPTTLGDCADFFSGGTPRKANADYWGGTIPWFSGKDLKSFYLSDSEDHVTEEGAKAGSRLMPAGTILLLVRGMTLHNNVPVGVLTREATFNQDIKAIKARSGVQQSFLAHWLVSQKVRLLSTVHAAGHGTGVLATDRLHALELELPPPDEQAAIADVFDLIEAKIEQNRRTSRAMERLARATFKAWFVDFEPVKAKAAGATSFPGMSPAAFAALPARLTDSPIGPVPEGWEVRTLEEVAESVKGLSYKGAGLVPSDAKDHSGSLPLHNLNSVYEGGGYKNEGIKLYRGEFKDRHVIYPGDLIVANTEQGHEYRLIGFPAIVPKRFGERGLFSHHLFRVRPLPESPLGVQFLYYALMSARIRDEIVGCTNGTTVNMLSIDGLKRPHLCVPTRELAAEFEQRAWMMYNLSESLLNESSKLAAMRDYLLPRLLSGRVRVREAERAVEEVA